MVCPDFSKALRGPSEYLGLKAEGFGLDQLFMEWYAQSMFFFFFFNLVF